jgi:hypothetical protein
VTQTEFQESYVRENSSSAISFKQTFGFKHETAGERVVMTYNLRPGRRENREWVLVARQIKIKDDMKVMARNGIQ